MKIIKIKAGLNSKNNNEANRALNITAINDGRYKSNNEKITLLNINCSTLAVKSSVIKIITSSGKSLYKIWKKFSLN
jgi:hypothetical protein